MNKRYVVLMVCFCVVIFFSQLSCSKSSPDPTPTPPPNDPCAGKTIVITATPTASTGCGSSGTITVSATGSTGFTYKLNSGGYQASGSFASVAAGVHTVYAKDAAGCERNQSVTVTSNSTLGVKFTAVKNLLAAKCQSCHNTANSQGGMNWTVDCNIVQFSARIKVRAVDIGDMPQGGPMLTAGEKAIITDWISAGGQLAN